MNILLIFQSLTYAQSAQSALSRHRINGSIVKPPVALGKGSCSHGVQVMEMDLGRARRVLSSMNMHIIGIYQVLPGSKYREIL